MLSRSNVLLLKQGGRLLNALEEEIKVCHVLYDFSHGQVYKHTSNLGSVSLHELLNKFENCATDSLLVVWIHFVHCTQNWDSNAIELSGQRVTRWDYLTYWEQVTHRKGLWWSLRQRGWLSNRLLGLLVLSAALTLETTPTLVGVVALSSVVLGLLWTSVEATLVEVLLLGSSLIHTGHQLLDYSRNLVHVSSIDCAALASFLKMALEVLFVFVVLVLQVTILLDLVVVNIKGSATNVEILDVFGGLSLIRSLVANESIGLLAVFCFKNAQGLNISELAENVSEVLLSLVAETFDIEVASLLGRFVLESLVFKFLLAFLFFEGGMNI